MTTPPRRKMRSAADASSELLEHAEADTRFFLDAFHGHPDLDD